MKHFIQLLIVLLLVHSSSALANGDARTGKSKAAPCVACHGQDGNSQNGLYPSIAGQHFSYLLKQLKAIQNNTRPAPLMAGQLDDMSEQDLMDIAAFYASQTPHIGGANAEEELLQLGRRIYRGGLMDKGVTACIACHSPRGGGNSFAQFPRLSGQLPAYITKALQDYRNQSRGQGSTHGLIMQQTAKALNDREIEALAQYIYGIH